MARWFQSHLHATGGVSAGVHRPIRTSNSRRKIAGRRLEHEQTMSIMSSFLNGTRYKTSWRRLVQRAWTPENNDTHDPGGRWQDRHPFCRSQLRRTTWIIWSESRADIPPPSDDAPSFLLRLCSGDSCAASSSATFFSFAWPRKWLTSRCRMCEWSILLKLGESRTTSDWRLVWTVLSQIQHVQSCTSWSYFITRTRAAQELQGSGLLHIFVSPRQVSSTCHVTFFAAFDTDYKHRFSLNHLIYFSHLSHSLTNTHKIDGLRPIFTCDVPRQSGGSTQITSLIGYETWSVETKFIDTEAIEPEDFEPRRIELGRNLGTDPYQIQERFLRNAMTEDMGEFRKVGAETSYLQSQMHSDKDSAESIADPDLEVGELRKMMASPLYKQERGDGESSRKPIAPGKFVVLIQERGLSAKRTQADHSRRESLTSSYLRNREHRRNLLHCSQLEAKNREINSRVLFSSTLTREIWEDLFFKAMKIICSIKQNLKLWDRNIKLYLSIIYQWATATRLCSQISWISKSTSSSARRIIYEGKGSWRYSDPNNARKGRN